MSYILTTESEHYRFGIFKYRFLISSVATAGDLINLWRYPYIVRKHGGVVLISLIIIYFLIGWPIYTLELSLGRLTTKRGLTGHCLSNFIPLLRGLDISSSICIIVTLLYQVTVVTWILLYLFTSIQNVVPWAACGNSTHTTDCVIIKMNQTCNDNNVTCSENSNFTISEITGRKYFHDVVIRPSSNLNDFGFSSWPLILCLLFLWFIVYLNAIKRKLSIKKRTAIPTVIIILLFTALFSISFNYKGALEGISSYLHFDGTKLGDPLMWNDAVTQVVLSLNIGSGSVVYFARRGQIHERLAVVSAGVILINIVICFYVGLVVYSWLGVLATAGYVPVLELLSKDFGFFFIVVSSAIATLPVPPLWSVVIFLVMALISVDRIGRLLITLTVNIQQLIKKEIFKNRQKVLIFSLCGLMACLGIIFTFGIGYHLLFVLDCWIVGYVPLLLAVMEISAICWLYGLGTLFEELHFLEEKFEKKFWKIMWTVVTPCSLIVFLVYTCTNSNPPSLGRFFYGRLAQTIGWCLVVFILSPCIIYLISVILRLFWIIKKNTSQNSPEINTITSNRPSLHSYILNQQIQSQNRDESPLTYHILLVKSEPDPTDSNSIPKIPYGFLLSPSKYKLINKKLPKLLQCPEIVIDSISQTEQKALDFHDFSRRSSHHSNQSYSPSGSFRISTAQRSSHKSKSNSENNLLKVIYNKGIVNEAYCSS